MPSVLSRQFVDEYVFKRPNPSLRILAGFQPGCVLRLGCDPLKTYSVAIIFLQTFTNELPGQDTSVVESAAISEAVFQESP